ncbi:hypothetical protein [Georgenia sp. AZ-5]
MAAPEALAAHLAERVESGVCFGTLDGACSAIAHGTIMCRQAEA